MTFGGNRIAVNAAATWGRGALALALGIFSSRWALKTLGAEGYGLWALCCSVNAFACFLQGVVANATQRYLSVAVGSGDWHGWYRMCVKMHVAAAAGTLVLAGPVCLALIGHGLDVPAGRIVECRLVMVWIFALAFASMINTPNRQLFAAHQRMVEPAVWGMISSVVNFLALAWMVTHPGKWLVTYSAVLALAVFVTEGALAWRARRVFGPSGGTSARNARVMAREVVGFTGWRLLSDAGTMITMYGMNILVNRLFGAELTGSAGIARSAATHTASLSSAVSGAYEPALANEAGAHGDLAALTYRAAVRQTAAYLVPALPFWIFVGPVLRLWLGEPPPQVEPAIRWLLAGGVFGAFGSAFFNAVSATGRVKGLYIGSGLLQIAALPFALVFRTLGFAGGGIAAVFAGVAFSQLLAAAWAVGRFRTACRPAAPRNLRNADAETGGTTR